MPRPYRREVLDPLGRVAGRYDALGMGDVRDRALPQNPETRVVTVGNAVTAMVLHGLGVVHPQRSRGPMFLQNTPTPRRSAPGVAAQPLHDETLGRALDTRSAAGVPERYRLMAVTAAQRLRLTPTCAPLERTRVPVDGRDHSGAEPDAHVMHLTRGSSREHRPALTHVRLDVSVAHHAGIPVLRKPLRGTTVAIPVMRVTLGRSSPRTCGRSRPPTVRRTWGPTARATVQTPLSSWQTRGPKGARGSLPP